MPQTFQCNSDVDLMLAGLFRVFLEQQSALYPIYALLAASSFSTSLSLPDWERTAEHHEVRAGPDYAKAISIITLEAHCHLQRGDLSVVRVFLHI